MTAQGGRLKKRERQDDPRQDKRRKSAQTNEQREERRPRPSPNRMANFTPLDTTVDQIFMQIRNDPALLWPDKLKCNPNKRPRNKYYRFHQYHRHDTYECYGLKQQIEVLNKQRKLQRFVETEGDGNLPKDPELNRQVKERPRAPFGKIQVIMRGSSMDGSSKKARKTCL